MINFIISYALNTLRQAALFWKTSCWWWGPSGFQINILKISLFICHAYVSFSEKNCPLYVQGRKCFAWYFLGGQLFCMIWMACFVLLNTPIVFRQELSFQSWLRRKIVQSNKTTSCAKNWWVYIRYHVYVLCCPCQICIFLSSSFSF